MLLGVHLGWEQFEAGRHAAKTAAAEAIGQPAPPERVPLIDLNMAPLRTEAFHYNSREDIRDELGFLMDTNTIGPEQRDSQLLKARVQSFAALLDTLMGREIDFNGYVSHAMGVAPIRVSEKALDALEGQLDLMLAKRPEGSMRYRRDYRAAYDNSRLKSSQAIQAGFNAAGQVGDLLFDRIVPAPKLPLKPDYEPRDAFWGAYLYSPERLKLEMVVNTNSDRYTHTPGRINVLDKHEIRGHHRQVSILRYGIEQGQVSPALGLTTMFGPEAVHMEGLAQLMELSLRYGKSWSERFETVLSVQRMAVINNVHYDLATGQKTPEEAATYMTGHLPFEPDAQIDPANLQARVDNPIYRAYIASYIPALALVGPIRDMPRPRQRYVLQNLYGRLRTPQQISEVINTKPSAKQLAQAAGRVAALRAIGHRRIQNIYYIPEDAQAAA